MSEQLIDRMEIRKDGVYLSSHLSDDPALSRTERFKELSEIYQKEGQAGLDREMINIFYEYAVLGAYHKSTARYHHLLKMPEAKAIHKKYFSMIDAYYDNSHTKSECRNFEREMRDKLYSELAALCGEYDRKHKNRGFER